jgi:hypothetical protein
VTNEGNITKWARSKIQSKEAYRKIAAEIITELATYLLTNQKDQISGKLKKKMNQGFLEHGPLSKTVEEIDEEIEKEYLDLIGWKLLKKYVQEIK